MRSQNVRYPLFLLAASVFAIISCTRTSPSEQLLDGEYWKRQGVQEILPKWTQNGIDSVDRRYHAFLDRQWKPFRGSEKYPGMISRHLFSYSAAYMMSGEPRFLEIADTLFVDLATNGWDREHGGWYYAIGRDGNPVDSQKDLFMNIYAATGLAMYYMITHNSEALELIQRTQKLMGDDAWDSDYAGYYRRLNRAWQVTDSSKVFTPQVAPVSGYLLYLFSATQDSIYLENSRELISLTMASLQDDSTGWIREGFGPHWETEQENNAGKEHINIGHNIEVAWMLLRLFEITGNEIYLNDALPLADKLFEQIFHNETVWPHKTPLNNPGNYNDTSPWWIQAYGNMLALYTYHTTGETRYLDIFKNGSRFWNTAFVDSIYGGTVLSATLEGKIDRGDKAVRTKTSYHALEHALLNYLYLDLWVNEKPVTLYFSFNSQSDEKPLCPLPVEGTGTEFLSLEINGQPVSIDGKIKNGCIDIQSAKASNIKVTLK